MPYRIPDRVTIIVPLTGAVVNITVHVDSENNLIIQYAPVLGSISYPDDISAAIEGTDAPMRPLTLPAPEVLNPNYIEKNEEEEEVSSENAE